MFYIYIFSKYTYMYIYIYVWTDICITSDPYDIYIYTYICIYVYYVYMYIIIGTNTMSHVSLKLQLRHHLTTCTIPHGSMVQADAADGAPPIRSKSAAVSAVRLRGWWWLRSKRWLCIVIVIVTIVYFNSYDHFHHYLNITLIFIKFWYILSFSSLLFDGLRPAIRAESRNRGKLHSCCLRYVPSSMSRDMQGSY